MAGKSSVPIRTGNGVETRIAVLEQNMLIYSERVERLHSYVFGSDDDDGLKSQVKNMSTRLDELMDAFEASQQETSTIRQQGFDRLKALEDWRKSQDEMVTDRKGLRRQYTFLIASVIVSSGIGTLLVRLIERFVP